MEHGKANVSGHEGRIALFLLKGNRDDVKDVFLKIRDQKLDALGIDDYEKILAHKSVAPSSWGRLLKTLDKFLKNDHKGFVRILPSDCRLLLEHHCDEAQYKGLCPEFYEIVEGEKSDTTVVAVEWSRQLEEDLKMYWTLRSAEISSPL